MTPRLCFGGQLGARRPYSDQYGSVNTVSYYRDPLILRHTVEQQCLVGLGLERAYFHEHVFQISLLNRNPMQRSEEREASEERWGAV